MFIDVFRWLLNLAIIAIPWGFISQVFLFYNLFFNIDWNFIWAGGNVFLIVNTVIAVQMTMHSVLLVTELPLWIMWNKFGRWIFLGVAIVYNILYTGFLTDFLLLIYGYDKEEYDDTTYGVIYTMESMFFAYNLILHFPICIVNAVVILKEFTLEFF